MPQDYNLEENHELRGRWWLPSKSTGEPSGTLFLNGREGARLSLEDSISGDTMPFEFADHPVILGNTLSGVAVTLCSCSQTKSTFSFGVSSSEYRIKFVYVGHHFHSQHGIKLAAAYFWVHNGDEWVNRSGFSLPTHVNIDDVVIQYGRPKDIPLHTAKSRSLSVGFSVYGPNYTKPQNRVEIRQEAYLKIMRTRGKDLSRYLETYRAIEAFLSLAIKGPVYPRKVKVALTTDPKRLIDVFYAAVTRPVSQVRLSHDMVFSLPDVVDKVEVMMRLWLRHWQRLKPACNIYLGVLYGKSLFMENRFLGMTQILETFHRRFIGGSYQNEADYLKCVYPQLVEAIPRDIEADYRNSLEAKLRYCYEYSLRKRIGDLLRRAPEGIVLLFLGTDSGARNRFVNRVVDTRNYFTHYTKELGTKAASDEELYWLYVKLRILCELMFFRQMGLRPEEIEAFVAKNDEYQQEFRLCRKN